MKVVSRILLLIATLVTCTSSYGQFGQGAIYGRVLDDRDGKPLQGAVVRIEHLTTRQSDEAKTNRNGQYSISGLFQGQYRVTVLLNGTAVMVKGNAAGDAIYVASGLDVSVNFDLRTAPATLPATATAPLAGGGRPADGVSAKGDQNKAEAEMRASFSAGMAALKANNYEEAVKQFRAAAEKDATQSGVFQNLGLALGQMKKYDESAVAYRKAIELKPGDAGLYSELSSALADAGKLDEATAPLEEAAKLNPSVGAQGYYNLGVVLTNRGKSKEAVDAFSKAVKLDANYPKAYYQLGIAYFGSANTLPQAVAALEKFLQFKPAGPDAETAKQLLDAAKAQLKE